MNQQPFPHDSFHLPNEFLNADGRLRMNDGTSFQPPKKPKSSNRMRHLACLAIWAILFVIGWVIFTAVNHLLFFTLRGKPADLDNTSGLVAFPFAWVWSLLQAIPFFHRVTPLTISEGSDWFWYITAFFNN